MSMPTSKIKVEPLEVEKQCQCGRWHHWEDYEENLLCECGRLLALIESDTQAQTEADATF